MLRFHSFRLPRALAVVALVMLAGQPAWAEKRVALVVGNGAYRNAAPLANPASDARAMAEALTQVGFELVGGQPLLDLDKPGLEAALSSFGDAIRGADAALFYYSGHGMQVDGVNYLIPVTAAVDYKKDVKYQLVDGNFILDEMQTAGAPVNIIILDACRNNPFGSPNFRAPVSGLAHMDAPKGTLIAYSTAPGRTARDGDGQNSPYSAALARHIPEPGLRVEDVFIRVRQDVDKATGGAQSPWEASNLYSPFHFIGPDPTAAPEADPEIALWQSLAKETDPALLDDYVRAYPAGRFVSLAKTRLERLRAAQIPPPPKAGDVMRDPATGLEFVWVPGGCFPMGSPDAEEGRYEDEGPVREVCVDGLWMGKTEVTNRQFRLFKPGHDSGSVGGRGLNGEEQPAVFVTWEEAAGFADWLTAQGGGKYRLPTEAEWEYAARAGTVAARFWGADPANACGRANVADQSAGRAFQWSKTHGCDDGYAVSAPVGSFPPNPLGLFDVLGNVREWCRDVYSDQAYRMLPRENPSHAGGGAGRANRGGSWSSGPREARSAQRKANLPDDGQCDLGFRLTRLP